MTQKDEFDDQAHALIVQRHQVTSGQAQLDCQCGALAAMRVEQQSNQAILDMLLAHAESMVEESAIVFETEKDEAFLIEKSLYISSNENQTTLQTLSNLDCIEVTAETDWKQYLDSIETYAISHNIIFEKDPFRDLMSVSQRIALENRIKEEFSLKGASCDIYDYMIAGTCGLIGGLIDVIFVGVPGDSKLGNIADKHADKVIEKFAELMGFNKDLVEEKYKKYAEKKIANGEVPLSFENYLAQRRIQYLEGKFKVNYDHRHGGDVKRDIEKYHPGDKDLEEVAKNFKMSTKNHHVKNLAHSPDLIGLFFSILDQFTNSAHFIHDGKIIKIRTDPKTFELQGGNFVAKVFCGFVNWLGHIGSDLAGSNNSVSKGNRGTGVPIPFYSLLQFIEFGEFGQHRQTFAKIAVQVFEQGYDFRHGMALAIPVVVAELLTRITWVAKLLFYHNKPWSECIPSGNNPELRRMLLIAHGSLCLVDTTDATLRSNGNIIQFLLRSNLIAWGRFGTLALKELKVWYCESSLDIEAVDNYLDAEYNRLLTN